MKKFALLSVLLLASLAAQAYVPLVREGVKWVFLYNDVTDSPDSYPQWYDESDYSPDIEFYGKGAEYYSLEFIGDTVVNNTNYKKLYCSFEDGISVPIALLRESNKRVYARLCSDVEVLGTKYHFVPFLGGVAVGEETLLYDFGNVQSMTEWTYSSFTANGQMFLADENVNVYQGNGELADAKLIEGVGIDCEAMDMLSFPVRDDVFTCICPRRMGLVCMKDAQGNIIYKGVAYQESESHSFDLNGDGQVDISDVNLIIDYILGK